MGVYPEVVTFEGFRVGHTHHSTLVSTASVRHSIHARRALHVNVRGGCSARGAWLSLLHALQRITNESREPQRLHIIPPNSPEFKIHYLKKVVHSVITLLCNPCPTDLCVTPLPLPLPPGQPLPWPAPGCQGLLFSQGVALPP